MNTAAHKAVRSVHMNGWGSHGQGRGRKSHRNWSAHPRCRQAKSLWRTV